MVTSKLAKNLFMKARIQLASTDTPRTSFRSKYEGLIIHIVICDKLSSVHCLACTYIKDEKPIDGPLVVAGYDNIVGIPVTELWDIPRFQQRLTRMGRIQILILVSTPQLTKLNYMYNYVAFTIRPP